MTDETEAEGRACLGWCDPEARLARPNLRTRLHAFRLSHVRQLAGAALWVRASSLGLLCLGMALQVVTFGYMPGAAATVPRFVWLVMACLLAYGAGFWLGLKTQLDPDEAGGRLPRQGRGGSRQRGE